MKTRRGSLILEILIALTLASGLAMCGLSILGVVIGMQSTFTIADGEQQNLNRLGRVWRRDVHAAVEASISDAEDSTMTLRDASGTETVYEARSGELIRTHSDGSRNIYRFVSVVPRFQLDEDQNLVWLRLDPLDSSAVPRSDHKQLQGFEMVAALQVDERYRPSVAAVENGNDDTDNAEADEAATSDERRSGDDSGEEQP